MISALAQWERDEISDRVAASVPIRAKLGKPLGGPGSFGYRWVNRKLVPHPDEAPIRKRIYELFLEHRRKKTVARILNQAGHRTRNKSKFSDTTIDRLLKDPTAKGLHRANYTKSAGTKRRWDLKPESEWIFTDVEPIVSVELWQQCNDILREQGNTRKKPSKKTVNLFSGFAQCICGSRMYVPWKTQKYTCFKCRNKMPIADLEAVYLEQLKGFFMSSQDIAEYLHNAEEGIKEKKELLATLERSHQKLKQEMDETYQLYIDKQITSEGFGKRYLPMEEKEKQLEEEIPRMQAEIDLLKINLISSEQISNDGKSLYESWPQLEYEEKRKTVEAITESIIIGKDEVEVNLSFLPTSLGRTQQKGHTSMSVRVFHGPEKGMQLQLHTDQKLFVQSVRTTFGSYRHPTRHSET